MHQHPTIRVAVAGLGAIGLEIAASLDAGIDGLELVAVSAKNKETARLRLAGLAKMIPILEIAALEGCADLVVECAPAALLPEIAEPFLHRGKTVVVLSAGALLSHPHLIDLAKKNGAQIVVPSGAILGLDAVAAAAEGNIEFVRMTTRKPPRALADSSYFIEHNIDAASVSEPLRIFSGTSRQAAAAFPANANVAVALALAGVGADRTTFEIWADPNVERNTHSIEVNSDVASFTMTIANQPSENPRTSKIAALSVLAYLRKLNAPLRVGS